jgi:hypothetical protein
MTVAVETRGTEVEAKAKRRRFTAECKRRILQEAAACAASGDRRVVTTRGALLLAPGGRAIGERARGAAGAGEAERPETVRARGHAPAQRGVRA